MGHSAVESVYLLGREQGTIPMMIGARKWHEEGTKIELMSDT